MRTAKAINGTTRGQVVLDGVLILLVSLSAVAWCIAPHAIIMMMKLFLVSIPYIVTILVVYSGRRGISRSYRFSRWLRISFMLTCLSSAISVGSFFALHAHEEASAIHSILLLLNTLTNLATFTLFLLTGIGCIFDKNKSFIIDPPEVHRRRIAHAFSMYDTRINKVASWSIGPKLSKKKLFSLLGQAILVVFVGLILVVVYQNLFEKLN